MSDKEIHNAESLRDTRWTSVIEELRQWSSAAPEWEAAHVQEFIDQVQIVVGQKDQEREEAGRLQFQQALDQLREEHEAILVDYFQCSDLCKWEAACCPMDRINKLTEKVKDLLELLDQRQALYKQVPQIHLEGIKQRKDLDDVERQISTQVEQLGQDFSIAPPELPRALDEGTKEDVQPSPEPESTRPGQGPSSDSLDSDQEQKAEEDLGPSTVIPQKEFSPTEEEIEPETVSQSEEHEPTHIETVLPEEPQAPAEKPLSLRSARDVALLLQKDDADEHWVSLAWSLLAEGDWAGAYWLLTL